jgi:hypothetical protein
MGIENLCLPAGFAQVNIRQACSLFLSHSLDKT